MFNSLRHSAGHLAFALQAQSRGGVKPVDVNGWFAERVVHVETGLQRWLVYVGVNGGLRKRWFV